MFRSGAKLLRAARPETEFAAFDRLNGFTVAARGWYSYKMLLLLPRCAARRCSNGVVQQRGVVVVARSLMQSGGAATGWYSSEVFLLADTGLDTAFPAHT